MYAFTASNPLAANNTTNPSSGVGIGGFVTPTPGSLFLILFFLSDTATDLTIIDNKGLSWTFIAGGSSNGLTGYMAYAFNPNLDTNDYPALNFNGSATFLHTVQGELIGNPSSSILGASNASNPSAQMSDSVSLAGVQPQSAVVAVTLINDTTENITLGNGYSGNAGNNGTFGFAHEYNLDSASGDIAPGFSYPLDVTWNSLAMAFNPGSSPSAAPSQFFFGAHLLPLAGLAAIIRRRRRLMRRT